MCECVCNHKFERGQGGYMRRVGERKRIGKNDVIIFIFFENHWNPKETEREC